MGPSNDTVAFREVLRTSRSLVILAGAGLSAASGKQICGHDDRDTL
jgi:NAD-dependent SIR2 family protein deacetylase